LIGDCAGLDEVLIGLRLFQGSKVVPLYIFREGNEEGFVIGELANQAGDSVQAGFLGGSPAALTDDDLIFGFGIRAWSCGFRDGANQDGLKDAYLGDRGGEFAEFFLVNELSRLQRAGGDGLEGDFHLSSRGNGLERLDIMALFGLYFGEEGGGVEGEGRALLLWALSLGL
jgi:hypothetical protein